MQSFKKSKKCALFYFFSQKNFFLKYFKIKLDAEENVYALVKDCKEMAHVLSGSGEINVEK